MLMVKEDWSKMVSPYKTSILEHPGHFTGDWTFFEGASVAVKELSFTRFGFPSSEFRRCMQSDGSTMEIGQRHGNIAEHLTPYRKQASRAGVGTGKTYPAKRGILADRPTGRFALMVGLCLGQHSPFPSHR
jgi:hypothetical protein